MVVLLALTAPAQDVPVDEPEASFTEQVEVQAIDRAFESSADCLVQPLKNG